MLEKYEKYVKNIWRLPESGWFIFPSLSWQPPMRWCETVGCLPVIS